jgi:hypothetical protein
MRHVNFTLALTTLALPALSLLGGTARADAPGSTPSVVSELPPSSEHSFSTMDRVGNRTSIGADLALHSLKTFSFYGNEDHIHASRVDLHARYVHPTGAGIGIALPITMFSEGEADEDDENSPLMGNLSLDGLYRVPMGDARLFLRAGLVLPTGSHDSDQVAVFGSLGRITDITTNLPDSTVLRLSVSPEYAQGKFFFRGDAGVDLVLDHPEDAQGRPWGHLNLAAGYDTGPIDLAAEIANQHYFASGDDHLNELLGGDSNTITNVALSARYTQAAVEPHIALIIPTNDNLLDLGLVIGAEGKLPI